MANPIIKLKRRASTSPLGAGAPAGLVDGEIAVNFVDSRLYIKGDQPTPLEFADKAYVDGAITSATGSLGTMSTQNANNVAITGGTVTATLDANSQPITNVGTPVNSTDATNKSYVDGAITTATGALGTMSTQNANAVAITGGTIDAVAITSLANPVNSGDAANKSYVDSSVSALGSVFHYVGDTGTGTPMPFDLTTYPDQATGAYYKVVVAGAYTDGPTTFNVKVGDALVKTTTGWQKLDNVDAEVFGTANEIAVSGDENVGYTVALDSVFKGRISDLENKTQNIDLAGTSAGTTVLNGALQDSSFSAGSVGSKIDFAGTSMEFNHTTETFFSVSYGEIKLGAKYSGPGSAVKIQAPLVGDGVGGAAVSIENFVIDGGSF